MTKKKCFKCGEIKALTAFYKHPRMADGHLGKCKECTKRDVQKNYRRNIDHFKEYNRKRGMLPHRVEARQKYLATDAGKAAMTRARRKYRRNNPAKAKANQSVNNAIRSGKLKKMPCEVCGSTVRIHGHHDDYSKPLDVRWLCPKHHAEHHAIMNRTNSTQHKSRQ